MKLSSLFTYNEDNTVWENTKNEVSASIDKLLEKGSHNDDVLLIMKEILNNCRPSMMNYIDEDDDG